MPKDAKNKEKNVKEKKEKKHFLKDVKAELKKVIWPTPKQLINNTVSVIVIVLIVGVIVFLLDLCFEKLNTFGVENLKSIVQSTQTNEIEEEIIEPEVPAEENTDSEMPTEELNVENESEENTQIAE